MKQILILITLFFLAISCENIENDLNNSPSDPMPITLTSKGKALVEADNTFGLELFRRINEKEVENITISPLSVSLALAMTFNGAEGGTKTAMAKALKKEGFSIEEINQSYKMLIEALMSADEKVTMDIAQSIWYREGFHVLDTFINANSYYYNAEVNALDFFRPDALDIINGWIEDKTRDKIRDMISEIDPAHVMFLINAIYFNGVWKTRFDKDDTEVKPFYGLDEIFHVEMMSKKDSVEYLQNDLIQAIRMPYGRGNFNMVVILPQKASGFNNLSKALTQENWNKWMHEFTYHPELNISLPKFKVEYEIQLKDILSAMGMGIAFGSSADFSGINGVGGLYIDYVQHNTFIDVNENGTEAAAATVVAIRETATPKPSVFNANRPFIFAITEKETGAIIFIGKIVDPEY